jgi:hypothetical protein
MRSLALVAALLQAVPLASDARQVALSPPQSVAEIDLGKLKGDLTRLSWSPDGSEFYIQTAERDRSGQLKTAHHYLVSSGAQPKDAGQEPDWAVKYWAWKAAQASPASPAFSIAIDGPRRETKRSTAAPTGGTLARGGTADPAAGTTVSDVASAAEQTQVQVIYALKVRNETLGEWVNEAVTPGVTFGWAPAPARLLAFTRRDGGPLQVIDDAGRKQTLAGARSALFPAWSNDGRRLAWLERKDRKKLQLTVAEITTP